MKWPWDRQPDPEPDNPRKVLADLAEELLRHQDWPSDRVRQGVHRALRSAVNDPARSNEFLSSAQKSRDELDDARSAAARELGRREWAGWALAGALAAFAVLSVIGQGIGTGLAPWIIAALTISIIARVAWRLRLRSRHRDEVAEAEKRWRAVLRDEVLRDKVLRSLIVSQENSLSGERLELTVAAAGIEVASYGRDPELAITSSAMENVAATARAIASGSIGISGPRGAGKSTILNKFDTRDDPGKPEQDVRVNVAAPVDYNAREFIIHLFTELCERVQREAPKELTPEIATETRRHLERLRFLRTYSSSWGATLQPLVIFNLTGNFGRQRAEQPAGLPDIVAQFREYSAQVAEWNRSRKGRSKGRLVICIDEMDKIRDSARAEQFLNDIKAIFDVPGCLYLVAISEDAMTVLASQTPAIRTAFDSAFDEIVSVAPMTFAKSQELLDMRVTGVPRPFLALCHVLAGGVPRELIRAARALIHAAGWPGQDPRKQDIGLVTRELVRVRCEVMRQQAILQLSRAGASDGILLPLHRPHWPGRNQNGLDPGDLEKAAAELNKAAEAQGNIEWTKMCQDVVVALSFYATVIELFGEHPTRVAGDLKRKPYELIDELAVARHVMRMNSEVAQALLVKYRKDHQVGDRDDAN